MITSFLSEHSVEFCLVPQLCRILDGQLHITPVYFWSTREGSRLAIECEMGDQIRILALFARRPKMEQVGSGTIHMKVNVALQQWAVSLQSHGIPVICGVPLVSSILHFSVSSSCAWFSINASDSDLEDIHVEIAKEDNCVHGANFNHTISPLCEEEILQIADNARFMQLRDAIEVLKAIGRVQRSRLDHRFMWFGANYKPVYLLLRKKEN